MRGRHHEHFGKSRSRKYYEHCLRVLCLAGLYRWVHGGGCSILPDSPSLNRLIDKGIGSMAEIETKYVIYEIKHGHLEHPKNFWGDTIFNTNGYDSTEEVEQALVKSGSHADFIVLTKKSVSVDWSKSPG